MPPPPRRPPGQVGQQQSPRPTQGPEAHAEAIRSGSRQQRWGQQGGHRQQPGRDQGLALITRGTQGEVIRRPPRKQPGRHSTAAARDRLRPEAGLGRGPAALRQAQIHRRPTIIWQKENIARKLSDSHVNGERWAPISWQTLSAPLHSGLESNIQPKGNSAAPKRRGVPGDKRGEVGLILAWLGRQDHSIPIDSARSDRSGRAA